MVHNDAPESYFRGSDTTILVIDDEEVALEELKSLLEGHGIHVVTASAPRQAHERLNECKNIGIVLCDIRLGTVSGLDLVKSMRAACKDNDRSIQFVAVTGFPDVEIAVTCFRYGFSDFIRKPIDPSELLNSLRGLHKSVPAEMGRSVLAGPEKDIIEEMKRNLDAVSEKIQTLVNVVAMPKSQSRTGMVESPAIPITAKMLEGVLKARSSRNLYFSAEIFSDPAWDMLLDLFLAKIKNGAMVVSSLCVGSGAPISTAHRRLSVLEDKGLIYRRRDKIDTRRVFVELTEEGERKMRRYLEGVLNCHFILT